MINKNVYKTLLKFVSTTLLISIVSSSVVFAKTNAILTKHPKTGHYFQYDLAALNNDAVNKVLELASPLYDEYMGNVLQAFYDDENGYIDSTTVNSEAVNALINGTTFDLNAYTKRAPRSAILVPNNKVQCRILANNGSVANGVDIEVPQKLTATVQSVTPAPAPGNTIVVVSLPKGMNPTKYTVTIAGMVLDYNTDYGNFVGIVAKYYDTVTDAQADLILTSKVEVVATVVSVAPAPAPGSTIVVVTLPKGIDATKYTVTLAGIPVSYNSNYGKFGGLVNKPYATVADAQADLVLKLK